MRVTKIIERQFENELVETQKRLGWFSAHGHFSSNKQLNGNRKTAEYTADADNDNTDLNNVYLRRLIYSTAMERAKSHKWNISALMLSYSILVIVIILTLNGAEEIVIAPVACFGLAMLWLLGWLQTKKATKVFYQQEMRHYLELLSSENNLNGAEKLPALDSVESPLTHREHDILEQAAMGKSNKEIGEILNISGETVKNHLVNIFTKLDVADRTSAVVVAVKHHWIKI